MVLFLAWWVGVRERKRWVIGIEMRDLLVRRGIEQERIVRSMLG